MRAEPSILHLDLDAFFAAVEKRDKPSLASKPVIVGGTGLRGVVATASYEARAYGARSAMSTGEARRLCPPGTAFLGGRFAAYRMTSEVVMAILRDVSPIVEVASVDEAYVDLAAADGLDLTVPGVTALGTALQQRIAAETGGVTASVGIGSSKMIAKIGSDLRKPHGLTVIPPGDERALLRPLSVTRIGGVGPATAARLSQIGVRTVADLERLTLTDLTMLLGVAHGTTLYHLARAEDDRPVVPERDPKSVSAERTFPRDLTGMADLGAQIDALAAQVARRLRASGASGRTVTLKVRRWDFTTLTRSATAPQPTDDEQRIAQTARRLLVEAGTVGGIRLLGVGVSGLADYVQEDLFTDPTGSAEPPLAEEPVQAVTAVAPAATDPGPRGGGWFPGQDVCHDEYGPGWVWGSGLGRVTVRFEGPTTPPGPVRTLAADDPALHPADPPDWRIPI